MKLRKLFAALLAALLLVGSVSALADVKIGVPNDTTNEAGRCACWSTTAYWS